MTLHSEDYVYLNKREESEAQEFFRNHGPLFPDIDEGGFIWRVLHFTPCQVRSGAAVQAIEVLLRTPR